MGHTVGKNGGNAHAMSTVWCWIPRKEKCNLPGASLGASFVRRLSRLGLARSVLDPSTTAIDPNQPAGSKAEQATDVKQEGGSRLGS